MSHLLPHIETGAARHAGAWRVAAGSAPAALLVALLTFALAGCTSTARLEPMRPAEIVPPAQSFVFPPPGGPTIVSVIQKTNPDGVQQAVALATDAATPGENSFKIRLISRAGSPAASAGGFPPFSVSEAGIAEEIRSELPGTNMVPANIYVQNVYGPFAYAVGRSPYGDGCLYAWQEISAARGDKSLLTNSGRIELRLRLCAPGRSGDDLVAAMYGFTIAIAYDGAIWNPYGSPADASIRVAAAGVPVLPPGLTLSEGAGGYARLADGASGTPASPAVARAATVSSLRQNGAAPETSIAVAVHGTSAIPLPSLPAEATGSVVVVDSPKATIADGPPATAPVVPLPDVGAAADAIRPILPAPAVTPATRSETDADSAAAISSLPRRCVAADGARCP